MKKSLLVVVALLCMASLMAAMAYTSATVTNAAQLKIVNTSTALLALTPGTSIGNLDQTASIVDGNLVFEFGKGKNGTMFGLQKNSVYYWESLFKLTNNSTDVIKKYFEATNVPAGVTIEMKRFGHDGWNWFDITNQKSWDKQGNVNYPVYSLRITISNDVSDDVYEQLQNMSIIVYAEAQAS